jgi:biotin operon repressor
LTVKKYREIAELLDISRKQLRKEMAALKILKEQIKTYIL